MYSNPGHPKGFAVALRPRLWRYGMAVLVVALATLLTWLVRPIAAQTPFAFYFGAILLAGFYGGLGPNLLAVGLTVLVADFLFIAPAGTVLASWNEVLVVGTFSAIALLLATGTHMLQRSRQTLHERERFLQHLTDNAPNTLYLFDVVAERALFVTSGVEKMLGYPGEAVLAGPGFLAKYLHPEDRPRFANHVAALAAAADGVARALEYRLRHADGSWRWYMSYDRVYARTADGGVEIVLGVVQDITDRKQREQQILAHASMELSASLDYRATLQRVAALAVPQLADWCVVDMVTPGGSIELVACAHVDPAKVAWAYALRRSYPPSLDDKDGLAQVIRSGQPQFYPFIPPELLDQPDLTEEQRRLLEQVGFSALIIVPMRARGQVIGALTLVWAESGRRYSEVELAMAEELAGRAAIAVDNARLYEEARMAELQQAELLAQMEALFANAPIGIAFFDRQLCFVRVNGALAAMNGLPPEAHLEHNLGEILPGYQEVLEPHIRQVFATGQGIYNLDISDPTPAAQGEIRHYLTSWYPVMMVDGRPLYVGAMVVDITERKRVEQALRSSEERFRSTFEQAAVGMSHVGIDGRWLRVNDRLCEIVGYDRREMMQRTFQSITHPEDLGDDLAQKDRVVAGEIDGYHMEKRYLHKNGSLVWVNLTVSAVRPPGQTTPAYLIAVVEDITERKRGEIRLQLLADLSEILATTLGDAQMLQSVVELLVPRLADWCVVNVLGQDDFIEPVAFIHVEGARTAELARLIEESPLAATDDDGTPAVIRTGSPYFAPEITAAMIAGDEHLARLVPIGVASMIIVPLRIREQSLGAITLARSNPNRPFAAQDLGVAEELARRVAMAVDNARLYRETRATEAQLRQLNETLEERVTERTSELERSNRELDRFAYVASHDLKAPLRAIENLAFWIEEDAYDQLPETSRAHLHKLRSRVRRMERLLEDLLSYSRAGRVLHEVEEVDTGALARSVFDLLAPPPGFTLLLSDPMPTIDTQRVPLETVLRNLVGNAIKHHHREDGIIEIAVLDAGEQVEFSIKDDGPGIAPHYHGRVFEMFQTLQPRDHVEGSGMGLAIVKKLVESFGGTIRLHSVEGAGATFCFTWPKSKVVT